MNNRSFSYALIFALCFFLACNADTEKKQTTTYLNFEGNAFGTFLNLSLSMDKDTLRISQQLDSVLELVNQAVSTYRTHSWISQLNQADKEIVLPLDDPSAKLFIDIFLCSQELSEKTNGYFDPSTAPLSAFWGFGPNPQNQNITNFDTTGFALARKSCGMEHFKLVYQAEQAYIRKDMPQAQLDFNAIAKGYGVDLLADLLSTQFSKNIQVNIGGELVCYGQNPNGQAWTIGINTPKEGSASDDFYRLVKLTDGALASSGNYRQFHELKDKKLVHTINPKTGMAQASDVLQATVICSRCYEADALATALLSMGFEEAQKFIGTLDDVAVLLRYTKGNEIHEYFNAPMKTYLN